jgi:hypothetical protein
MALAGVVLVVLIGTAAAAGAETQPQAEARKQYRRVAELMGDPKAPPNPAVQAEVQGILKALESQAASTLEVHRDRLANGSSWEKSLALHLLANLGAGAKPAVPEILKATRDDEERVKRAAVMLLAKLDQSDATIQRLSEVLLERGLESDAADALGEMGPRASMAVPALIRAGKEPGRWWADWVVALGKIHSNSDLAVPALVEAIPSYPIHATAALARFGREARRGVPASLRVMQEVLNDNLKEQGLMVRALQVRDGVEAALAAAYGVEKGANVLITFERVRPLIEPEHRETLKQIADKLKAAELVDVVLETRPLENR